MAEFKCHQCNKNFSSNESLSQHVQMKHGGEVKATGKKNSKKYIIIFILIVSIALIAATFYIRAQKPGQYDEFAKCLNEKQVVIYGNDFCQYTTRELNFFGNSDKYLNYVKCIENKEICDSKGVKITPTWEINGKMYEGVQSLEKLSELSGCKLQKNGKET